MANYAQTVNVIGCVKTTKTHADFDSTALPLMLYRRQFGTLPLTLAPTAPPLDVSAALTIDKKYLTIGVVNPTDESVTCRFKLVSAPGTGPAQAWVITGTNLEAFNQPGEARRVDVAGPAPADLGGPVTIKPYGITVGKALLQR
jgi:alpha-L-arabinofuranosidase